MWDKQTEHTFHEIEVGADLVTAVVVVTWRPSDVGIGDYEFWGEIGYDSNYIYEPKEYYIEYLIIYSTDGEGVEIPNTKEYRKFYSKYFSIVESVIEKELDEMEPPEFDGSDNY